MALPRVLWLAVPLAGVLELGAQLYFARRAPRPEEWTELREPVTKLRANDELVVVAPRWAEPLARQALGDALMPLADVARPDESRYARAIEISILGQQAPELAGWRSASEQQHGRFRLRILENPAPQKVLFDFVDGLSPDKVAVSEVAGGENKPCVWKPNAPVSAGGLGGNPTFPAKRFTCGSGEWFFVGATVIDDHQEYRPRRCLWAHPTPGGPLRITFRGVPLGRVVRGYAGMPWLVVRDGTGAPVELEVRVDGTSLGTHVHRDAQGWAPFELGTGERAGRTADVEFEVRSTNVKERHFCFQADTR